MNTHIRSFLFQRLSARIAVFFAIFCSLVFQSVCHAATPTFASPQIVSTAPRADNMVTGDFDKDGHQDVAVLDANTGNVEVRFGDGAGGYQSTTSSFTITGTRRRGMAAADLDGDGKSELIFASSASVLIYEWQSDGSFTDNNATDSHANIISLTATGIDATKVAVGDLTAAGSRDIVVSDDFGSKGVVWIPNDGAGTFGTPAKYAAGGVGFYARPILADVDGDGLDEVVLARQDAVGVLLNKGDGTLDTEVTYGTPSLTGFQIQNVAVRMWTTTLFPILW